MKQTTLFITALFISGVLLAQSTSVSFDSEKWNTENANFTQTNFRGKEAILFDQGRMFLDEKFLNGTVEFDIHFSAMRNFPGIDFRVRDGKSERFYIRPHQSGNPDANQYTPVFNGTAGWQLYYGENHATPILYDFRIWHHVKIEVMGSEANVYLDDMDKPLLEIEELLTGVEAGGFSIGTGGAVYLANFQYSKSDQTYELKEVISQTTTNYIASWQVSNLLADTLLRDQYELDKGFATELDWRSVKSETSGIVNLARYNERSNGNNTVIAKATINASKSAIKPMEFGFSDRVTIYVNGKAVYSGNDGFVSRDYRFLGTIGFFDKVYLPLKKGKNEILFVVTERFGGWGVQARFEDINGVTF